MIRSIAALFVAIGVSSCSPYVYTQEISAFGTGVNTVAASYQTGQQTVDSIVAQQREASRVAELTPVHTVGACLGQPDAAAAKQTPCSIVPASDTTAVPPTQDQSAIAKAAPTITALKNYATALVAVTNAADDTTLTQAEQGLTTAAGGLATALSKIEPAAGTAGTVVTQASTLIGLGITTYLDYRRYKILRTTVTAADPAVSALGQTILAALNSIRAVELQQASSDLQDAQNPLLPAAIKKITGQSKYQTLYAELQAKVAAFNQISASDPTATVNAMTAAHSQLAAALQNGTGESLAVLAAVQNFVNDATSLKASVDSASKPTPAKASAK